MLNETILQGGDAYQSAYYVFDEIAQLPSANNTVVLNGKAIAQACMGNWPEAEASLTEASSIVSPPCASLGCLGPVPWLTLSISNRTPTTPTPLPTC